MAELEAIEAGARSFATLAIAACKAAHPNAGESMTACLDEDGEFYIEWPRYIGCGDYERETWYPTIEQLLEFAITQTKEN